MVFRKNRLDDAPLLSQEPMSRAWLSDPWRSEQPAGNRSTGHRRQRATSRPLAARGHIIIQTHMNLITCSSSLSPVTIYLCILGFGYLRNSAPISRCTAMPGIHFAEARAGIALAEVLDVLGFVPSESSGNQVRGPCPVHHSISPSSRSFSANIKRNIYILLKCGSCRNPASTPSPQTPTDLITSWYASATVSSERCW